MIDVGSTNPYLKKEEMGNSTDSAFYPIVK
jgi:hypothetical protein